MSERVVVDTLPDGGPRWVQIAALTRAWAQREGLSMRDLVVLLPFAQLLPAARHAYAASGEWLPRIETVHTLAASVGPAAVTLPGQLGFDATTDQLVALELLLGRPWGAAWQRRDPRGFERAVVQFVATAHELGRAASALPPARRDAYFDLARNSLPPASGPGTTERMLARMAVEWACLCPAPATDRLFGMPSIAGWVVVQAGGAEPLAANLVAESATPFLWLDTDPVEAHPFDGLGQAAPQAAPQLAVGRCDGFEHEAQCTAAQVIEHVRRGETPVALIAQDRLLMRRVRALLERHALQVVDETGWKLSTTHAAAQVMSLLRAAAHDATTDALIDWLKSGTGWRGADQRLAIGAFERECRAGNLARVAVLDRIALGTQAERIWRAAAAVLRGLVDAGARPLQDWLVALAEALHECAAWPSLETDDAGWQVIEALRMGGNAAAESPAWSASAQRSGLDFSGFRQWVDSTLERATFVPSRGIGASPDVVVTPLAHAMLRPFAAVVFPGADDAHLGAAPAPHPLLSEAVAGELGLPTAAGRRRVEILAFVHGLQAAPRVTLLHRRTDGAQPLAMSPLLERLSAALAARGLAWQPWRDPRVERHLAPTPIGMTAPGAPGLVPLRLSASGYEALRACPYRFFALYLLGLREPDELEREVEKREYGTWLHAVLFEFHRDRAAPAVADAEVAQLHAIGERVRLAQGLGDADFVPYAASFATLAPRYVAWLHRRDGLGARWNGGEERLTLQTEALGGTELHGVLDRIDEVPTELGLVTQLIDYKTSGSAALKSRVGEPFEDTQLAFYALLMQGRSGGALSAAYLALDDKGSVEEVPHKQVARSAEALLEGLALDLRRVRGGAGLAALGEGAACEKCAARGVCRRDDWSAAPLAEAGS